MTRFGTRALFTSICLVAAGRANADQTIFDTPPPFQFFGSSTTITYPVSQVGDSTGIVGFGTYDTVNGDPDNNYFLSPSAVTDTWSTGSSYMGDMYVYNASTVNVNGGDPADPTSSPGGYLGGSLFVCGTSTVNVGDQGKVYSVLAFDQSIITINGGTVGLPDADGRIGGGLALNNGSKATINGGTISGVFAVADSTVTINGGTLGGVTAGSLDSPFLGDGGTHVSVTGGNVTGSTGCSNGASLNITGGTFTSVSASNGGNVSVNGAILTGALVASGSTVLPTISTATLNSGSVAGLIVGTAGGASASISMLFGQVNGDASAEGAASSMVVSGGNIGGNVAATSQSFIGLQGGTIGGNANENQSTLDISGGCIIGGDVNPTDGQVNMSGGTVTNDLLAAGAAVVTLTGGKIQGDLQIGDESVVYMSGGSVGGETTTFTSSNLFMTGGMTANMQSQNGSSITMTSGSCSGSISAFNSSNIVFSGTATLAGALNAHNSSFLYINGGEIDGGVNAYDNSVVTYNGGIILGGFTFNDNSQIVVTGGNTEPTGNIRRLGASTQARSAADGSLVPIYLNDNSSLEVDGINLNTTLLDPGDNNGMYSKYELTGYFGDGTPIAGGANFYVQNPAGSATGASFALVATPQLWNVSMGGSWQNASNWLPNIIADGPGAVATFDSATAPATVSLDGDRTVGFLTLGGSNSYTIVQGSGGTLYLDNQGAGANVLVYGVHEILAPVMALDNTTIDIEYTYDPATDEPIDSSLTLAGGITVASGKQLVTIERGGEPLQAAFVRGGALNILTGTLGITPNGTPAGASTVEQLTIGSQGLLDLADNSLIVNNSAYSDIRSLVRHGYCNGSWNGPCGITSSSAAVNPGNGLGILTGVQYQSLHPGAQFNGNSVAPNDVLIQYTLVGDANCDGQITPADYQLINAAYQSGTPNPTWLDGDFNYDGVVNFKDFALIDASYEQQGGGTLATAEVEAHTSEFGEPYVEALEADGGSPVPEPSSVGLLAFGGAALLRRLRSGRP